MKIRIKGYNEVFVIFQGAPVWLDPALDAGTPGPTNVVPRTPQTDILVARSGCPGLTGTVDGS